MREAGADHKGSRWQSGSIKRCGARRRVGRRLTVSRAVLDGEGVRHGQSVKAASSGCVVHVITYMIHMELMPIGTSWGFGPTDPTGSRDRQASKQRDGNSTHPGTTPLGDDDRRKRAASGLNMQRDWCGGQREGGPDAVSGLQQNGGPG